MYSAATANSTMDFSLKAVDDGVVESPQSSTPDLPKSCSPSPMKFTHDFAAPISPSPCDRPTHRRL